VFKELSIGRSAIGIFDEADVSVRSFVHVHAACSVQRPEILCSLTTLRQSPGRHHCSPSAESALDHVRSPLIAQRRLRMFPVGKGNILLRVR
jgi:hypothetical protein